LSFDFLLVPARLKVLLFLFVASREWQAIVPIIFRTKDGNDLAEKIGFETTTSSLKVFHVAMGKTSQTRTNQVEYVIFCSFFKHII
jgi:hypothetical protein